MADLDTRSKRASCIQILKSYIVALPETDGSINQVDRQHIAFCYSGIIASTVLEVLNIVKETVYFQKTLLENILFGRVQKINSKHTKKLTEEVMF